MKRCVFLMLMVFTLGLITAACNDDTPPEEANNNGEEENNKGDGNGENNEGNGDGNPDDAQDRLDEAIKSFDDVMDQIIVLQERCPHMDMQVDPMPSADVFLKNFPEALQQTPDAAADLLDIFKDTYACYADNDVRSTCVTSAECTQKNALLELDVLSFIADWKTTREAAHKERMDDLYTNAVLACEETLFDTPKNCAYTDESDPHYDRDDAQEKCMIAHRPFLEEIVWSIGFQVDIAECLDQLEAVVTCHNEETLLCGGDSDACQELNDEYDEHCDDTLTI